MIRKHYQGLLDSYPLSKINYHSLDQFHLQQLLLVRLLVGYPDVPPLRLPPRTPQDASPHLLPALQGGLKVLALDRNGIKVVSEGRPGSLFGVVNCGKHVDAGRVDNGNVGLEAMSRAFTGVLVSRDLVGRPPTRSSSLKDGLGEGNATVEGDEGDGGNLPFPVVGVLLIRDLQFLL